MLKWEAQTSKQNLMLKGGGAQTSKQNLILMGGSADK